MEEQTTSKMDVVLKDTQSYQIKILEQRATAYLLWK